MSGLVLLRSVGQSFRVGRAQIKIIKVRGKKVWVLIDAPADVAVHREEIYQRIQRQGGSSHRPDKVEGGAKQTTAEPAAHGAA